MKRKLKFGLGLLIFSMGVFLVGCNNSTSKKNAKSEAEISEVIYTCPMHPEIEQNEPGDCPKCGMKLEEKKAGDEDSTMQMAEVIYTCPMHPEIEKHEAGSCHECGMDLVKKETVMEHSEEGHVHE